MSGYSFKETVEHVFEFEGPGLPRHANRAKLGGEYDAKSIQRLLHAAYEAGRQAKAEEVRTVLGVYDTPWGLKIGERR